MRGRLWLSLGVCGATSLTLYVGACRKPGPDELVYTGAQKPSNQNPSQGGSASLTGGTSSGGAERGGSGGTSGDSTTGGGNPNGGTGAAPGEGGAGAGGEAGTPDPCDSVVPSSEPFTKRGLLEASAACARREVCLFQNRAKTLNDLARAAASEPSEEAMAQVRDAWLAAMEIWDEAEVLQFGPAAASLNPGGRGLRDLIYSWPLAARCKVDEQTVNLFYAKDAFFGSQSVSATSGRTLHALEYLLFYTGTDNGCTPYSTINSTGSWGKLSADEIRGRKLDYAARAAQDVMQTADALALAWDPEGEDFGSKLVAPGAVYPNEQKALNAVANAIFYVEIELKDVKLAVPLGLDMACPSASCPESVEALYAHTSVEHIARNLRGFRKIFQGCADENEGVGFDDWLTAVDAGDLSNQMLAALDGAEAAVATLDAPLETLIVNDPARVRAIYDAVKRLTDLLKTQFVTTLNLERPKGSEGDND